MNSKKNDYGELAWHTHPYLCWPKRFDDMWPLAVHVLSLFWPLDQDWHAITFW